jgi:hypothetical protein
MESTKLPMIVNLEVSTTIYLDDSRPDFRLLKQRLQAVLDEKQQNCITRPPSLAVGGKEVPLPAFVRSVSSHETLVPPHEALLALELHPATDPVLASAFDLHHLDRGGRHNEPLRVRESLKRLSVRGCGLFLDSGNYEAYRRNVGASQVPRERDGRLAWTFASFSDVVRRRNPFDIVLSFDDPILQGNLDEAIKKSVHLFEKTPRPDNRHIVVPIVHLPRDEHGRRDPKMAEEIVQSVVDEINPGIVAIPERELGDGIVSRVRTVAAIRSSLDRSGKYPLLHLLGTGNPLSILLLAAAGADVFDGLEWCRVVVDPETGYLHHAQHFDFYSAEMKFSEFQEIRDMARDETYPLTIKVLVHNIDFFHAWMKELRDRIARGDVISMLRDYLGEERCEKIHAACDGVFPT